MALACAVAAGAAGGYQLTDGGVIVDTPGGSVRVVAATGRAIRVSAVPGDTFPSDSSLIIVPGLPVPEYVVTPLGDDSVEVRTRGISARVNLADGVVDFFDASGRMIVSEEPGSRSFTPIRVDSTDAYTVGQRFRNLFPSEGIYGLGQHQSDEFNYKGRDEQLFQYNTKVSVPFVMSTEGYGVLWDSYSMLRWGNPDDYSQLGELFTLRDADGREGALTGRYISAKGDTTLTRREEKIYFEHLMTDDLSRVVNLPEGVKLQGGRVIYEGTIEPHATGDYRFILYYSGYQRVTVDGKEVMPERWRTAWNPNSYKFTVPLTGGKPADLRIEWIPNGSVAYCGLRAYAPVKPETEGAMAWWGEMQPMIDYYVMAADNMDGVIAANRELTGRAPVMPRWVSGFWQSREKYNTQKEVLSTLSEFRRRNLPIDNIVIDWLHWPQDAWGSHEFDHKRFPDPKGMVDSIHGLDARVMISVWPKFYATTEHFREFDDRGWMYRRAITDSIRDWVGPGYIGSFYDAYAPGARALFWEQIADHYVPLGIDAWWMDASEPNVRDCTDMDYRKALCGPTALGPSTEYFNAYALMNAEAIYNGQRNLDPDRRVFLLTRSGFSGLQRYSTATWSGDIATRWEDMKAQISAGLNFSASGIPWWSMDIGGFCVEDRYVAAAKAAAKGEPESDDLREWRELNSRWYQFGAFTPMFRSHGQWPFREIFNIAPADHEAYRSIEHSLRLRYQLMPYIYSLSGLVHFADYTIMRPMSMDFPADTAVYSVGDQYMFGPAFLVAPVTEYGARSRSVVFPAGTSWHDYYTGRLVSGGGERVDVDAPYERMPLFVRAGSIIPEDHSGRTSTAGASPTDITLRVYPGADGSFVLYDDDGTTYGYERGEYTMIPVTFDNTRSTLTIGASRGSLPAGRRFRVINMGSLRPTPRTVVYSGTPVTVKL